LLDTHLSTEPIVTGLILAEIEITGRLVALVVLLLLALAFEFINGFHDTANAVATVIYTKALRARSAVVLSGVCNFIGVHIGGIAVAYSIVHLLPVDLLVSIRSDIGMAMVLALLLAAIIWNLGTWYLGLPASSSHTLIGAVLGIGLANAALSDYPLSSGVKWDQALHVGASLLVSPLIGFMGAAILLFVVQRLSTDPRLNTAPVGDQPPPPLVRAVLIGTCSGVSLAHGSNDGQKGVGLIMLILIGIMPARFGIDPKFGASQAQAAVSAAERLQELIDPDDSHDDAAHQRLERLLLNVRDTLGQAALPRDLDADDRWRLRAQILQIDSDLRQVEANPSKFGLSRQARPVLAACRLQLSKATDYAPQWVIIAVACALGCGTMVGWKRIVVTIGEKIGNAHLTYAQGASAEVVAMATIGLADFAGLPVSTTQVLSSGIAGTMAANRSGLQHDTIRKIAIAWALTLPVAMLLSATLFTLFRQLIP
jgi:phosphate/sulfate permease